MQWKQPKNTDKYQWTQHVAEKMHYYGLSEQKVLGVIRKPFRIETGIVENTVAVMVPVGNIKKGAKPSKWKKTTGGQDEGEVWNQEIWAMYQIKKKEAKSKKEGMLKNPKLRALQEKIAGNKQLVIISAWRYPGVSPKNNPIPEEIMRELAELL